MSSQIIINSTPFETRIAYLEHNILIEAYIEWKKNADVVGNVYKGRVLKVLPGIQAAFVDIGMEKAGFLYVADIDTMDIIDDHEGFFANQDISNNQANEEDPLAYQLEKRKKIANQLSIANILKEGQELIVQVAKNPIGSKGARITSYITLPGRYLVYMPTIDQIGISRRIENEEERKRLKAVISELKKEGSGYIIRTASDGKDKKDFEADITFLSKLWENIKKKNEKASAPTLLHHDLDLALRTIRDLFTEDVDSIIIDEYNDYERCREFINNYMPHLLPRIVFYNDKEPIFERFGIEMEIERALGRKIWLKSGGYIIIDQTEALVSIDVNTGRYVGKMAHEETILKTNLEAVKEIVYQLRLRNIGGLIIIDFIDMEKEADQERVYKTLEHALKSDRSRTTILKFSPLGIVEMTRKRERESLTRLLCQPCFYCEGNGYIKSPTTICYEIFREIGKLVQNNQDRKKIVVNVHPNVADVFFEEENWFLEILEQNLKKQIIIESKENTHQEHYEICFV